MATVEDIVTQLLSGKFPVASRMRAIFGLKGLNTATAVCALEQSLRQDPSALVRHEVAYVLGQMRCKKSLPTLCAVLNDQGEDVMVRHEAAEAMGAIGDCSVVPLLTKYAEDVEIAREIRETCVLSLARIGWEGSEGKGKEVMSGGYESVDPAPAAEGEMDTRELGDVLCDRGREMYERYRAMFALRNRGGKEAVEMLCRGMDSEKESALFRHEVAYVLGQMQSELSVPTLIKFLRNESEHAMVRHEAAEALGAVGSAEAERELERFRTDKADVVRESVEVALDITGYVTGGDLHYAETIGVSRNEATKV